MVFFGVCREWERHAIFRLGKFHRMVEPGLYFYIPLIDRVLFNIDTRILTYTVPLQKGLTRDNIPVEVDAIVFYQVKSPENAVLQVDEYHEATQLSARSAIRDMVGKSSLDELLGQRTTIGKRIRSHVEEFTSQWGVAVIGVEIKDVVVSHDLEDAIAREAAAEREKRARLKLAEAENLAAESMIAASRQYEGHPIGLQLRSMNMLYEMCMEGRSTMVFVPTESSGTGIPSVIGMESYQELIEKNRKEQAAG